MELNSYADRSMRSLLMPSAWIPDFPDQEDKKKKKILSLHYNNVHWNMVILQLSMRKLQMSLRESAQEFLTVESPTSIYNLLPRIDSKARKALLYLFVSINTSYISWQQAKQSGK